MACEHDQDSEALHLARAARLIRRDMFANKNSCFDGSVPDNCQANSVPPTLKALVNMILEGSCSKTESVDNVSTSCTSAAISQLIASNCAKKKRDSATSDEQKCVVRHSKERETPLPLYIRSLINTFSKLGLSISCDRVLSISADVSNSVCRRFE